MLSVLSVLYTNIWCTGLIYGNNTVLANCYKIVDYID